MPEIIVHALEGLNLDQKRGLCKDITEAVVKHTGAPVDGVMVMVVGHARDSKSKGGVLFHDRT